MANYYKWSIHPEWENKYVKLLMRMPTFRGIYPKNLFKRYT